MENIHGNGKTFGNLFCFVHADHHRVSAGTTTKCIPPKPDLEPKISKRRGSSPPIPSAPNLEAKDRSESEPREEVKSPSRPVEGAWSWLTADLQSTDVPKSVVVESGIYKVSIRSLGAIPTAWNLLKYEKLFKDPRYLRLIQKSGVLSEQQLGQLELSLYDHQQNNGPETVNAIDTTYPEGKAGLVLKWGKNLSDISIPYQCEKEHFRSDKARRHCLFLHERGYEAGKSIPLLSGPI